MVVLAALIGTLLSTTLPLPPGTDAPLCPEAGPDSDQDLLTDACEFNLLRHFAPALVVSQESCNWSGGSGRLRGGYLVGAQPTIDGVRLAYLPAYLQDCGWSGHKCLLRPRGGCDLHPGDSEAVFIDVAWDAGTGSWVPRRVFLSAHCFGHSDGRCRWFDAEELTWMGSTAVVWVAEGKNANYPSKDACDSGHWHFDSCDRNDRAYRFPVATEQQNIGSVDHPFPHHAGARGCVQAPRVAEAAGLSGTECIWSADRFSGWSGEAGGGSTGYRRYLEDVAGFLTSHAARSP